MRSRAITTIKKKRKKREERKGNGKFRMGEGGLKCTSASKLTKPPPSPLPLHRSCFSEDGWPSWGLAERFADLRWPACTAAVMAKSPEVKLAVFGRAGVGKSGKKKEQKTSQSAVRM